MNLYEFGGLPFTPSFDIMWLMLSAGSSTLTANFGTDKSCQTSALLHMFSQPEAFKRSPVKTRLINQFFLEMYIKSAGMLPDKCLG